MQLFVSRKRMKTCTLLQTAVQDDYVLNVRALTGVLNELP